MTTFLVARRKIGKQVLDQQELRHSIAQMKKAMVHHKDSVVFYGAYDGFTLQSIMCQQFSAQFPNDWNMSFIITRPGATFADFDKNGHDALWAKALSVGRTHGRNVVRWSMPAAWERTQGRTMKKSPAIMDLHIEQYARYAPGVMPTDERDMWIYGERVKPYEVILKRAYSKTHPSEFDDASVMNP
jgi:hypothetical protein